jgi:3',5'-cyclic AMP phosphodiesterase CpdA
MKTSGLSRFMALWVLWWRPSCSHVAVHTLGYSASAEVCDGFDDTQEDMMHHHHHSSRILNDDQLSSYRDEGFIVLRGVLNDDLVHRMAAVGHIIVDRASRYPQFFSVVETGLIFNGGGGTTEEKYTESTSVFREVALKSDLPQIAAELMELDPDTQNLRVLR